MWALRRNPRFVGLLAYALVLNALVWANTLGHVAMAGSMCGSGTIAEQSLPVDSPAHDCELACATTASLHLTAVAAADSFVADLTDYNQAQSNEPSPKPFLRYHPRAPPHHLI